MNLRFYIIMLLISPSTIDSLSRTQRYTQKIKSFFNRYAIEKIDHKEFSTASLQSISIENFHGPITIKTGWKKKYLCLKTIKRAKNHTHLESIKTISDIKTHHLSIHTQNVHNTSGYVEYELIVPSSLTITLQTNKGDIFINDIKGNIHAITHNGTISIINTKNNINAQASAAGSIYIENAEGCINATSYSGDITIHEAHNSIKADTKKGKIFVDYKKLPPTSSINLETISGSVCLAIPTDSDATINSITTHGTIISEHFITLKPYTTQLNTLAWNKLKKEIHGTIGEGQATIDLSSLWGNIKILEIKNT